jgi:hypothetical protein
MWKHDESRTASSRVSRGRRANALVPVFYLFFTGTFRHDRQRHASRHGPGRTWREGWTSRTFASLSLWITSPATPKSCRRFPSCTAWSTLPRFSQHPETGVLPIPNRTLDLTHQRSLLHAEQNAPKARCSRLKATSPFLCSKVLIVLTAAGHSSWSPPARSRSRGPRSICGPTDSSYAGSQIVGQPCHCRRTQWAA